MNPFANIDPNYGMFYAILIVGGTTGLAVAARTLYLLERRYIGLQHCAAIIATGATMLLIAGLLYLTFDLYHATVYLLIIGATEVIILGTPLAKYHILVRLDPAVAERVNERNKSWHNHD